MHINTIKNLLHTSPESLVPAMMSTIKENFRKPALVNVTKREYGIMCTPEGEAYDQTVFEK